MTKALLQWNRRNLLEVGILGAFLEFCQPGTGLEVVDLFLSLLKGKASPLQDQVVHFAHAPKGLSQKNLLLRRWVEPIFVGALSRSHGKEYS